MALLRQGSGPNPAGVASPGDGDLRPGSPFRLHDHIRADQKGYVGLVRSRSIKKRPGRVGRSRKCSIGAIVVILLVGVVFMIFGADFVFPLMRNMKAEVRAGSLRDLTSQNAWAVSEGVQSAVQTQEKEVKETARESYEFRQISTGRKSGNEAERASTFDRNEETWLLDHDLNGDLDADAKYWESDGRTRYRQNIHIELDDDVEILARSDKSEFERTNDITVEQIKEMKSREENTVHTRFHSGRGREEEHFLNASLKEELRSSNHENEITTVHGHKGSSFIEGDSDPDGREESRFTLTTPHEDWSSHQELKNEFEERFEVEQDRDDVEDSAKSLNKEQLIHEEDTTHDDDMSRTEEEEEEHLQPEQLPGKTKKKRKRSIPPCEISFLNSTRALRQPTENARFESFSLTYRQREEKPADNPLWEPRFAGHQTLLEREVSFVAKDQEDLHCGFVRGPTGYRGTGFEISKEDMDYLQTCHIAVSSCIFGNYDHIRNPSGKKVTSASKKKVCFAMFVDQPSLDGMKEEGEVPDENMNLGLWRIVLIKNVPFPDNRRTGKVPKFLTHRLFPNARYSVWLDSKLRLQSDPLLILEYLLWRGHHEYAISNHYDRHCVWEEVEQNKKLNKYNHSVIDQQFAFYQADGLPRFNASDPNKLLPSHVPEGSFIVRAHTPMSNLFSCLWFNEVDRFTPRDQLSFAYTYLKLVRTNPRSRFRLNMFKDCERKAVAKLYRHKAEDALVKGRRH